MRKRGPFLCVLIGLIFLAGFVTLRWTRAVPSASGRILRQSSGNWESIPFGNGECAVVNNTWNRAAAAKGFEQSVFVEEVSGREAVGWQWYAPWHFPPIVLSQPEIVCGNKPWDPKSRPNDGFPFLAGTKRLTADFDVRLHARGVYNMVFSLWGVSAIPASRNNITHEIMIWTAHSWQSPAGQRVDSITVDGVSYEVYIEPHQTDASGQNANTWTYVAFVPARPVLHGPLEISAFLDYLLQHGFLSANHYLTSLEFGNEVSMGSGTAEITGFAIRVY